MAIETFPVEAGHIMMFARAVGDANKIYYDEAYARTTEVGRSSLHRRLCRRVRNSILTIACGPKLVSPGLAQAKNRPSTTEQWGRGDGPACGATLRISPPSQTWRYLDGDDTTGADLGKTGTAFRQIDLHGKHYRVPGSTRRAGGHVAWCRRPHGTARRAELGDTHGIIGAAAQGG